MSEFIKKTTILISIIILVLGVLIYIMPWEVNVFNFLFNGFKIVALITGVRVVKHEIRYVSTGMSLVAGGIFFDLVRELNHVVQVINEYDFILHQLYNVLILVGIIYVVAGIMDMLKQKNELIRRLTQMAYFDSVTDLPNRNFITKVNPLINESHKVTLLFIDLDDFKLVNDNLGHHSGDKVLKLVAKRLKSCVRGEDVVARISGDEFLIILKNSISVKNSDLIVASIQEQISQEMKIKNKSIHVHCSIGISNYPYDGRDIDTLIQHADLAMYTAKKGGKNQFYTYKKQLTDEISTRFSLQEEIKVAIKRKEFILYYQPKVGVKTNKITSIEALIRWDHPEIGIVSPALFIQIAEETGLIKQIDRQIIELACKQIKEWTTKCITPVNISVNVSPVLFKDQTFVSDVDQIISTYDIDPSYLTFEITEGIAIENISQTIHILEQLKERNIKIALDDFGKGYSSLVYIKDFPIDTLKLDKGFIDKVLINKKTRDLFETIITFARKLDIKVVSEGIETKEQLDYLKEIGCDEYQGFIHSKPMPIEDLQSQLCEKK